MTVGEPRTIHPPVTMDADTQATTNEPQPRTALSQALREHRAQTESFLQEQAEQLACLETELLATVRELAEQLDRHQDGSADDAQADARQWRTKAADLERRAAELVRLKDALTAQQARWREMQALAEEHQSELLARLEQRQAVLRDEAAALQQRETDLRERAERIESARKQAEELRLEAVETQQQADDLRQSFERRRQRLIEKEAELEDALDQVERRESETRRQRRRLARQIRTEREELRGASPHRTSDSSVPQNAAWEKLRGERDRLRDQVARGESELDELNNRLAALAGQVEQLTSANAELSVRGNAPGSADSGEELDKLTREKNELIQRLTDAEREIAALRQARSEQAPSDGAPSELAQKMAELQQRFALALEDVRSLKKRNANLEEQLAKGGGKVSGEVNFDWESQKKRLIAALESEFDAEDEQRQEERITVESTIRITDEIISGKDREIAELRQLLDDQSSSLGNLAVGANAIQAALDTDELIRQERQNLARQKEEMREKLRQAEVEISLERAKLARERAELDEKLAALEHDRARQADSPADPDGASSRGRWLARLGLKDDPQQP